MKLIAWYLPQYHRIKENDLWWGDGFTDWTNVKKAKSLFNNHYQPRIPLNNNYYDLSNPLDLLKQAEIAEKYGLFGFCFYHYWFQGKLLLEKPVEILLSNPSIKINYCFSWANESWARTWDGKEKSILLKQTYGNQQDWDNHFKYFLRFFKDKRYIKVSNKPMLLIYKTKTILNCKEMMDYWIKKSLEEGFSGIHFVETLREEEVDPRLLPISARVEFEPSKTNNKQIKTKWFDRFRRIFFIIYNKLLRKSFIGNTIKDYEKFILYSSKQKIHNNTYPGVFVGWDNTPRKAERGSVFINNTPDNFFNYLNSKINSKYNLEFLFINAWNEWAEGAYLEPDEKNKFAYLEKIHDFIIKNK